MMHTYSLENFSFSYPGQEQSALSQLTFDIAPGEILLLCGSSGCGKTTLLRQLKPNLAPPGRRSGTLLFQGRPLAELSQREQAQAIGFVQQSPENQIVTDKVWHELAFGLESLGLDTAEMRLRIAEMASFFGIQEWFRDSVSSLSGGQKQLLNLASVMVMHPEALILDEPTSQLDPIAAREFLDILVKVNRELGTTIIISEHRLEEIYPLADRVLVLDSGRVTSLGTPRQVAAELHQLQHPMFQALPAPLRIWSAVPEAGSECPLTPGEGRNWLAARQQKYPLNPAAIPQYNESTNELLSKPIASDPPLIRVKDVSFRYERDGRDVLRNLSMTVWPGEIYALVGGNGVGKSTTLSLLSGLHHPQRGKVEINGRPIERIPHSELYGGLVASLPQNPQSLFLRKTLELDLLEVLEQRGLSREEQEQRLRTVCRLCQLESLLSMHPYDLSGGEQQRAALAKVLLLAPRILLLDEPTKGLDAHFKKQLAHILRALCDFGVAVVLVSHDIEFCAAYADRCAMFFDGTVVAEHSPRRFFSDQNFYTTSTHRMARKLLPQAVLAEDVIAAAGGSSGRADCSFGYDADDSFDRELRRFFERAAKKKEKAASASPNFAGAEADVAEREEKAMNSVAEEKSVREPRRPLGRRSKWVIILSLLCVPLTVLAGMYLLDDSRYYLVSMLIILETLLPFILNFEGRKPKTRELVVIAVLVALGTVGRAICSFIPNVEPVAAIVVISGICLGGESGFLVGAVTAFVSNMLMGQGPWTPWQMLGFGLVGLVSGLVYRWGWLRMKRLPISIFGFLATVIIYGGLLNPAFVLMYQPEPTWEMILTAYAGGIPFDLLHGASTFIFLFILALPMSEKLARIKEKYGLDS